MKPAQLAKLLNVTSQTVRRWTDDYRQFFSPSAAPPNAGEYRKYTELDQRVMLLIAQLRHMGQPHEIIIKRLEDERLNGWADLPQLPDSWLAVGDMISSTLAEVRANQLAAVAALQVQLQHVTQQLAEARDRAERLEQSLQVLEATKHATEAERHTLEVQLERARADIARLEGQLSAYSFGREKPVHVGLIIAAVALITVLLVLVVLLAAAVLR